MPSCAAYGCTNRSESGFRFKVFPRDIRRRAQWTALVNRKNWTPSSSSYLCEVHFADDQWEIIREDGKKKLKANAIPTIFEINSEQKQRPRKEIESSAKCVNQSGNGADKSKRNPPQKTDGPRKRARKILKSSSDEEEDSDDCVQLPKKTPKYPVVCVLCRSTLVHKQKEYLSTLTKPSGKTMYEHLCEVSVGGAARLRDFGVNDAVCITCARLLKFVDRMEVDLALLKGAMLGCLQFRDDGGNKSERLKSHLEILEQFNRRILGGRVLFGQEQTGEKTQNTGEVEVNSDKAANPVGAGSPDCNGGDCEITFDSTVASGGEEGGDDWRKDLMEESPDYKCQLCKFHTISRSLLLFHLRRHMADYLWCDYCDEPLRFDLESEERS